MDPPPAPDLEELDGRHADRQAAPRPVADRVHLEGRGHRRLARVHRAELRGRAPHVEGDDVGFSGLRAGQGAHEHAGRRPGLHDPNRLLGREPRRHEPARGLHDEELVAEAAFAKRGFQARDVAGDEGAHVGVRDGGAGALVLAEPGRDGRGQGHREIGRPLGQAPGDRAFVLRVRVGVEQRDRHRLRPAGEHAVDGRLQGRGIERDDHAAVRGKAFDHLEYPPPGHQRRRLVHVEVVGLVALLPPDEQHVAEAVRGEQGGGAALAFDDRVGGDGRRVQDGGERPGRETRLRHQPVEALDHRPRRIVGGRRHLEEARRDAARPGEHEIGERAPDVERHPPRSGPHSGPPRCANDSGPAGVRRAARAARRGAGTLHAPRAARSTHRRAAAAVATAPPGARSFHRYAAAPGAMSPIENRAPAT